MPPQSIAQYFSGMPDLSDASPSSTPLPTLSEWENNVLHVVKTRWPTSSLEIAEFLGHACETREQKRLLSSRVVYHVKKLVEKKHVISKRFGNALIVWPFEVETLRLMHEMMDAKHAHHISHSAPHEKIMVIEKKTAPEKNTIEKIHPPVHVVKKSIWKEDV